MQQETHEWRREGFKKAATERASMCIIRRVIHFLPECSSSRRGMQFSGTGETWAIKRMQVQQSQMPGRWFGDFRLRNDGTWSVIEHQATLYSQILHASEVQFNYRGYHLKLPAQPGRGASPHKHSSASLSGQSRLSEFGSAAKSALTTNDQWPRRRLALN